MQVENPSWMWGGFALTSNLTLPYNRIANIAFAALVLGGARSRRAHAARAVRARRHRVGERQHDPGEQRLADQCAPVIAQLVQHPKQHRGNDDVDSDGARTKRARVEHVAGEVGDLDAEAGRSS